MQKRHLLKIAVTFLDKSLRCVQSISVSASQGGNFNKNAQLESSSILQHSLFVHSHNFRLLAYSDSHPISRFILILTRLASFERFSKHLRC